MTYRRRTPVPSTGTKKTTDDNGLSRSARDLRELPPGSGLLNPKWMLAGIGFWAVLILLVCASCTVSTVETTQGAGPQERVVIDGMGGGPIDWGTQQVHAVIERGQPIRLRGSFFSVGTMMLEAVRRLPGSCIEADARFTFHAPVSLSAAAWLSPVPVSIPLPEDDHEIAVDHITLYYVPSLAAWYRAGPAQAHPSQHFHMTGNDPDRDDWPRLINHGYPICADENRVAYGLEVG